MKWLPCILIFWGAGLARAEAPADRLTLAGIARFTAAYQAWDGQGFSAASELFRQASTQASASCASFYWLGTAEFHRLLQLQNPPAAASPRADVALAMDSALAALQTAVKLEEKHAESHALLGTLYGMRIDGNLIRAARFGPRVQKHRNLALKYGSDNPRVRYLLGTCQFHLARKPAAWREALASLLVAEKLFAAEARRPGGPLEPRWGHSSCLTFIGRTYELLGQRSEASDYFRQALAKHPADHLAREGLARLAEDK
jgi:hypothetical protein